MGRTLGSPFDPGPFSQPEPFSDLLHAPEPPWADWGEDRPWRDGSPQRLSTLADLFRVPMHLDWRTDWPPYGVGGVYVMWRFYYATPFVVHVGQAVDIANRFNDHWRDHCAIFQHPSLRPSLYGTWAEVAPNHRDGVERYVGDHLCPFRVYPNVEPKPVILPRL